MKNISFVLFITLFPLVGTIEKYLNFLMGINLQDDTATLILAITWIAVSVLLYRK